MVDCDEKLALHGVDLFEGDTTNRGPRLVRICIIVHKLVGEHEGDNRDHVLATLVGLGGCKDTGSIDRTHVCFVLAGSTDHERSLEEPDVM